MDHKFIEKLVIFEQLLNETYCLKSLNQETDGNYSLILSDKTGELSGKLHAGRFYPELLELVGGAVTIHAVIMDGPAQSKYANIKSIIAAKADTYKAADLFIGLSAEKTEEYIHIIKKGINCIKHPGYQQLCSCALTDVSLKKMSELPATLAYHCKYQGGALAATAMITQMVLNTGASYMKHGNGIYEGTLNWSLLLSGALLNAYGVLTYLTPTAPFRKTISGVNRGYMSVLQSSIELLIHNYSISLEEKEIGELLNILGCSVSKKTSVRAAHKEGVILRHCLSLYAELDMLDAGLSNHIAGEEGEEYFYDSSLHTYLAINQ